MLITEKGARIIKILAENNRTPLSVERIAGAAGMSSRSVRSYLKEVADFCNRHDIELVNKPGTGISIHSNLPVSQILRLIEEKSYLYSSMNYRPYFIISILLRNWTYYTVAMLQDDLYVGKSAILKDISDAEAWLERYRVTICRKLGKGLYIDGNEMDIRRAMVGINRVFYAPLEKRPYDTALLDPRVDEAVMDRLYEIYKSIDVIAVQQLLSRAEPLLQVTFTDQSFVALLEYLLAMISRIKIRRSYQPVLSRQELQSAPEYPGVRALAQLLEERFSLQIEENEMEYMLRCVCSCDIQYEQSQVASLFEQCCSPQVRNTAKQVVRRIGYILGVALEDDTRLYRNIALYLQRALVRLECGLELQNILAEDAKHSYGNIFSACWAANSLLEEQGIAFTENEIAQLTLIIGHSLEQERKRHKCCLISAGCMGSPQLTAKRIMERVPELEVEKILPYAPESFALARSYPLFITTLPSPKPDDNCIAISSAVNERDIKALKSWCSGRPLQTQASGKAITLIDILHKELMFLNERFYSKKELLEFCAHKMEGLGYVENGYLEDVLAREALSSTAVGNGVAVPHGMKGLVKKPAVCLVSLKEPIDWGEHEKVDIVFLLALNFSDVETTKAFFKAFYEITSDNEAIGKIRAAYDFDEVKQQLTKRGIL